MYMSVCPDVHIVIITYYESKDLLINDVAAGLLFVARSGGAQDPSLHLIHLWATINNRALNLFDQISNRDTTWASVSAIEDATATPDAVAFAKNLQAFGCTLVTTVKNEAMCVDD